jgi:hypothetical protein
LREATSRTKSKKRVNLQGIWTSEPHAQAPDVQDPELTSRGTDRWLTRHPNVHFHFTLTHTSWLNQVEIWFSILSRKTLDSASFVSPVQLREAIDAFIARYNDDAKPFVWTKAVVHQKHLSTRVTHP